MAHFFTNTLGNSKLPWMTSIMTILDYLDANFAMWPPWGHVTSSKVTKFFFLPITSHKKRRAARMVLLCSAHHSRRSERFTFGLWGHIKLTWPVVNSWSWPYEIAIYENIFRCVSMRAFRWYCYFCSSIGSKVVGKKKTCHPVPLFVFFYPSKNCGPCPLVSIVVTACL